MPLQSPTIKTLGGSFVGKPLGVAAQGIAFGPGAQPAAYDHVHPDLGINRLLFSATVNMNTTVDQAVTAARTGFGSWKYSHVRVYYASVSLTTAVGGVYTGAGKTGNILVAASQAYSALTNANAGLDLTLTALGLGLQTAVPIIALSTAQGATAAAVFEFFGWPVS